MTDMNSKVTLSDQVMFRDLGGEMVLLNIETGKYYGLDEVGARMWALLEEHGVLQAAFDAMLDEYDVSEEQLQADLIRLVDKLADHQLVMIR